VPLAVPAQCFVDLPEAASSPALRLSFVLESEALALDVDDGGVMEDAIEHRQGEHAIAGEG
jgi:hypothetical protein